MGAHLIDHSMWALNLGHPSSIETISTPFNKASYPRATMAVYEFPSRSAGEKHIVQGNLPAAKLTPYAGGLTPPEPAEPGAHEADKGRGAPLIGRNGPQLHETYRAPPTPPPKS